MYVFLVYINKTYFLASFEHKHTTILEKMREDFHEKNKFFRHFLPTTTFYDEIFYQTNTFPQTEVKFELQIIFLQ